MKKIKFKKYIVALLLVLIGIGYAVISTNLGIKANINFRENIFDVHFETIEVVDTSLKVYNSQINNDNISISFSGNFEKPGDYYDFSVYVMNYGTIDATLDEINITGIDNNIANYIDYDIKYIDETVVSSGDLLKSGLVKKIKVHFEYKYDIEDFISIESLNINIALKYINAKTTDIATVWDYDYIDQEQLFYVPKTGTYKFEVWGASGGGIYNTRFGGYGGYSSGNMELTKGNILYINIGGQGENVTANGKITKGGYNGGGNGGSGALRIEAPHWASGGSGGGATHIATSSGLLSSFENKLDKLLIVAGGGGGVNAMNPLFNGGSGGGYKGSDSSYPTNYTSGTFVASIGGTQNSGYRFGIGQDGMSKFEANSCDAEGNGGSGGGFYGGLSVQKTGTFSDAAGSGGSGYIGNVNLTDKVMYCYNCEEPDESDENYEKIKTISTTNVSEQPISNYAKIGNGYARITLIS